MHKQWDRHCFEGQLEKMITDFICCSLPDYEIISTVIIGEETFRSPCLFVVNNKSRVMSHEWVMKFDRWQTHPKGTCDVNHSKYEHLYPFIFGYFYAFFFVHLSIWPCSTHHFSLYHCLRSPLIIHSSMFGLILKSYKLVLAPIIITFFGL